MIRNQLGDRIDIVVAHAKHAPHVADDCLGGHGAEGNDLRHRTFAVFLLHIIDNPVTPFLAEIDIEVGHRYAVGIEEALKNQIVLQRIKISDAERIGDQRTGTRSAARAYWHAILPSPADKVGNDQEVTRKTHVDDSLDLVFETHHVARTFRVALGFICVQSGETIFQPNLGGVKEVCFDALAIGRREIRQLRFA